MADSDNSHLFFAKKLASNDLEMRSSTLKNLASFFSKSDVLAENDFVKIWMGLWYAMWMSDKPLVQRELAEAISKLIHTHKSTDNAIMFIKVFYTTMHREFPRIDRLRYDKFLKFTRIFVHQSLLYIKNKNYDSDLIDQYHAAQTVVWDMDDAQEIQLHVCDLFFEELFLACGTEVPSEAMFQFANLFADTLEKTNHSILKLRLFETLKAFVNSANYCSPKLAPKNRKGLDNNKDMFPDVVFSKVNLDELEKWSMDRASKKGDFLNRDLFYKLHDLTLKKQRAEPGFKLLPRGSIMKTMEEVEKQEYARLIEEYEKSKEEEEEEVPKSKQEAKRDKKRKMSEMKKAAVEARAAREKEEEQKKAEVEDVTAAEEPTGKKGKKNNNNKKRKVDPATPSPATSSSASPSLSSTSAPAHTATPKTTVTTVKQVKKNSRGEVVGKTEETTETIVRDDGVSKVTEVTTTTTMKEVKHVPMKKGAKKPEEVSAEVPHEEEDGKKSKRKKVEGGDQAEADATTTTTKQTKTKPTPAITATNGKGATNKRKNTEPETSPAPSPSPSPSTSTPPTNGKANEKKRKTNASVAEETQNDIPNGTHQAKGKKGKKAAEKVAEAPVEEDESAGITPKSKGGKKSKKEKEVSTPARTTATTTTPLSTGRKAVRFSSENLIKEFDKSKAVTTSPKAASPSNTPVKLKSLLTPPSKKK